MKTMTQKLTAVILALAMLFGMTSMAAADGGLEFGFESLSGMPGETVYLYIYMPSNPGFATLLLTLDLPEDLKIVAVSGIISGLNAGTHGFENGIIAFEEPTIHNFTGTGNLAILSIEIAQDAEPGEKTIGIYDPNNTSMASSDEATTVPFTFTTGTITVNGPITGDGSQESPYLLYTLDHLEDIRDKVNYNESNYNTAYYKLMADIEVPDYLGWMPIAYLSAFQGTFDGNGHTISKFYIPSNTSFDNVGLFGSIGESGKVMNLTISGAEIAGGSSAAGVVAGENSGTIHNVKVMNSEVSSRTSSTAKDVGGIVGVNGKGVISNCEVSNSEITSKAEVSGTNSLGGIVGVNDNWGGTDGTIKFCTIDAGTIVQNTYNGSSSINVGGIAGLNKGIIQDSGSSATVSALSSTAPVGGIFGSGIGLVERCYNTGKVTGKGNTGGIAGTTQTDITDSYNTGDITGATVGGIVGSSATYATGTHLKNVYSTGTVTSITTGSYSISGGLVGYLTYDTGFGTKLTNALALNKAITGTNLDYVFTTGSLNPDTSAAFYLNGMTLNGVKGGASTFGTSVTGGTIRDGSGWPAAFKTAPWSYTVGQLPILQGLSGQDGAIPDYVPEAASSLEDILDNVQNMDASEILSAVQDALQELPDEALTNLGSLDKIKDIEDAYKTKANITVGATTAAAGVPDFFRDNVGSIKVDNAAFNTAPSSSVNLKVYESQANIGIGELNAVGTDTFKEDTILKVGLDLEGSGVGDTSTLDVPVAITMPVPDGMSRLAVRVVHFPDAAGVNPHVIKPTLNGDGTITFIMNGFSTVVFVEAVDEEYKEDFLVRAMILAQSAPTYDVSIDWGNPDFTFDPTTGTWTLVEDEENPSADPTNEINVTNHSTADLDVELEYAMFYGSAGQNSTPFNADITSQSDPVEGGFYESISDVGTTTGRETNPKFGLTPAESVSRYFGFIGTPDEDAVISYMAYVGKITVTVKPSNT